MHAARALHGLNLPLMMKLKAHREDVRLRGRFHNISSEADILPRKEIATTASFEEPAADSVVSHSSNQAIAAQRLCGAFELHLRIMPVFVTTKRHSELNRPTEGGPFLGI